MYGLRDSDIDWIQSLLKNFPTIEEAYIFGSRARGTHRIGSDVDIALVGLSISPAETRLIKILLDDESPMPFFFDVVHLESITDSKFEEKIKKEYIRIYQKQPQRSEPTVG